MALVMVLTTRKLPALLAVSLLLAHISAAVNLAVDSITNRCNKYKILNENIIAMHGL